MHDTPVDAVRAVVEVKHGNRRDGDWNTEVKRDPLAGTRAARGPPRAVLPRAIDSGIVACAIG